ncbi:hypothetical protein [Aminobacter sp. BE322]|uniref:hypothetical protein n=1 Tax=unclassified Aminobacter TaxID=2644704 RepID=UPI003D21DB27
MATTATTERKKPVEGRIEREYRLYRIVAGEVGEICKAVAYLGMGGIRPVEAVEASSVDEAIALMKEVLETRLSTMQLERRDGVPTAAEFRESLAALPASMRESIRVLHIERLDPLSPSSALATLSLRTQSNIETIVDELRKAARRLGDLLGTQPEDTVAGTDPLSLLAAVDGTDPVGVPIVRFYDEFREAIATLPPERPAMMAGRR